MDSIYLLIRYDGKFFCENRFGKIGLIQVPIYSKNDDLANIGIFMTLLGIECLNEHYQATKAFSFSEFANYNEFYFFPDVLKQCSKNIYFYDYDESLQYMLSSDQKLMKSQLDKLLTKLPNILCICSKEEILSFDQISKDYDCEEEIVFYNHCCTRVSSSLVQLIQNLDITITDRDVMLLYSAGKDSTLAALRLRSLGYRVHFFHFDNGHMLDVDKPFLTFQYTFGNLDGYYFDYENRNVLIADLFHEYFKVWNEGKLGDSTLNSEIQCLSCRMAMYTKALEYACEKGFQYIAEGARISQKFMIEQPRMIEEFQKLASKYGIQLLFPVLNLEDDEMLKQELLQYHFSSKSWESKCLIGKEAKEKTEEDEQRICQYYKMIIEPKMEKHLNRVKRI